MACLVEEEKEIRKWRREKYRERGSMRRNERW
jgi:hypothetical protein